MRRFFYLLIVIAVFTDVPASAQGIYFGFKGGVNNTEFIFDEAWAKDGYGWFAGPTLKINILPFLGVQTAVFYSQSESKINDYKVRQESVIVPVEARLNMPVALHFGFFLSTGPQFGFDITEKDFNLFARADNYSEVIDNYKDIFQLRKSTFSWNFGAGIMLTRHLEVSAVYTIALANTGEIKNFKVGEKAKSKGWMASATLFF